MIVLEISQRIEEFGWRKVDLSTAENENDLLVMLEGMDGEEFVGKIDNKGVITYACGTHRISGIYKKKGFKTYPFKLVAERLMANGLMTQILESVRSNIVQKAVEVFRQPVTSISIANSPGDLKEARDERIAIMLAEKVPKREIAKHIIEHPELYGTDKKLEEQYNGNYWPS